MAYIDQFDDLVRDRDRGRAIRFTRTIAVFDDGLVVCPVTVYGAGKPGGLLRARRQVRPAGAAGKGEHQVKAAVAALGADAQASTLAEGWPKSTVIPLDDIGSVVLTRPRQVTRLAIREEKPGAAEPAESVFLGDLDADRVRAVLGPLLGGRLTIEVPDGRGDD